MLEISGKVTFVKQEKWQNGNTYKRVQVYSESNGGPAGLETFVDMTDGSWSPGKDVKVPVSIKVFAGKNGAGYQLTHFGGGAVEKGGKNDGGRGSIIS